VVLEARPVYVILEAQARGHSIDASHWSGLAVGLGLATLISLAAIALPLRTAVRRIEALEP
jgi:hypothetical protein